MRHLLLPLALLLAGTASAAPCEPYSHDDWRADLDRADAAFTAFDLAQAATVLDDVRGRVRCLSAVARPDHLARYGRQVSLLFYFNQAPDSAERWARMARIAADDLPWPDAVGPAHPFRALYDGAELPAATPAESRYFALPAKGAAWADGDLQLTPQAWAETPAFFQFTDKKGNLVQAWWQDGTAFPAAALTAEDPRSRPPRGWSGPPATDAALVASQLSFSAPERPPLPARSEPEPAQEDERATEDPPDDSFEYEDVEYVDDPAPSP